MVASFRCSPVAHARISDGVALSMWWTIVRSLKVASRPSRPAALPCAADTGWGHAPGDESTSISSLCLASSDMRLMSPILGKISVLISSRLLRRSAALRLIADRGAADPVGDLRMSSMLCPVIVWGSPARRSDEVGQLAARRSLRPRERHSGVHLAQAGRLRRGPGRRPPYGGPGRRSRTSRNRPHGRGRHHGL